MITGTYTFLKNIVSLGIRYPLNNNSSITAAVNTVKINSGVLFLKICNNVLSRSLSSVSPYWVSIFLRIITTMNMVTIKRKNETI